MEAAHVGARLHALSNDGVALAVDVLLPVHWAEYKFACRIVGVGGGIGSVRSVHGGIGDSSGSGGGSDGGSCIGTGADITTVHNIIVLTSTFGVGGKHSGHRGHEDRLHINSGGHRYSCRGLGEHGRVGGDGHLHCDGRREHGRHRRESRCKDGGYCNRSGHRSSGDRGGSRAMVMREEGLDAAVGLTEHRSSGHVVVLEGTDMFSLGSEHVLELHNDSVGVVVAP